MPLSKVAMRVYVAERRARHREMAIDYLGGECAKCGDVFNLEFDHIDPATKSFGISNIRGHGWESLLREVKKCQLLCKPCHKQKTLHNEDWRVA